MADADVIVVGAGLAGLVAAARVHAIREHDAELFVRNGTRRTVHPFCGLVVGAGQDPRFVAPDGFSMGDERRDELPAYPQVVVPRRDGNLVDPELGCLVGVHVVHAGRHADDEIAVERDGEMMARVREELRTPSGVDRVIKDVLGDVVEDSRFIVAEDPNRDRHREG